MKTSRVPYAAPLDRALGLFAGIVTLFAIPAFGQTNPVLEGTLAGAKAGEMMADSVRLAAEARRIRAETELHRERLSMLRNGREGVPDEVSNGEMTWAWIRLQRRIPDIHLYREEITKLFDFFCGGRARIDDKMEAFYLLAKQLRILKQLETAGQSEKVNK